MEERRERARARAETETEGGVVRNLANGDVWNCV